MDAEDPMVTVVTNAGFICCGKIALSKLFNIYTVIALPCLY